MAIWLGAGWLLGLWLGAHSGLGWRGAALALGVGALCLGRRWIAGAALVGLGLALLRMAMVTGAAGPDHVSAWRGEQLTLAGVVAEAPQRRSDEQRVVLSELFVAGPRALAGRVLLSLPPEPRYRLGDAIVVKVTLEEPRRGRFFDYATYLARKDIGGLSAEAEVVGHQAAAPGLRSWLYRMRERSQRAIEELIPEPEAALLSGVLLGSADTIDETTWEAFNRTGTSHLLVISGWNISIVIAGIVALGGRLGWRRWPTSLAALGLIAVYVLFVGPTGAVVRAAIMGGIVALAAPLERKSDSWTALILACVAMTVADPWTLWDIGFQLSALATASLFAWSGRLGAVGAERVPRWLAWAHEGLATTLAAQIWALPIILYHFGTLSLIAPLANVAVAWAVAPAMACGAAAILAGLVWRPLGLALMPLAWLPLHWIIAGTGWLGSMDAAAVVLPRFHAGWVIGYYGLTVGLWWRLERRASAGGGVAGRRECPPSPKSSTSA